MPLPSSSISRVRTPADRDEGAGLTVEQSHVDHIVQCFLGDHQQMVAQSRTTARPREGPCRRSGGECRRCRDNILGMAVREYLRRLSDGVSLARSPARHTTESSWRLMPRAAVKMRSSSVACLVGIADRLIGQFSRRPRCARGWPRVHRGDHRRCRPRSSSSEAFCLEPRSLAVRYGIFPNTATARRPRWRRPKPASAQNHRWRTIGTSTPSSIRCTAPLCRSRDGDPPDALSGAGDFSDLATAHRPQQRP